MSSPPLPPSLDPVLSDLSAAATAEALEAARSRILSVHARPVIDATLRRRASFQRISREDAEDIQSAALERVVRALQSLQEGGGAVVISRFEGYVASCARMAWLDFQRARAPERVRLLHQLRFLLEGRSADRRFTWREDAAGEGLAALAGQRGDCSAEILARLRSDPAGTIQHWLGARTDLVTLPLPTLVERVLQAAGGAVPLEALLDALAAARGLGNTPPRRNIPAFPPPVSARTVSAPSSHPDDAALRAHAARSLPPASALKVSDHLAACGDCRARLRGLALPRAVAAPVELDPPQPASGPDYETLATAALGQLDPESRAHLERQAAASPQIVAELADLQVAAATPAILPFPPARSFSGRLLAAAAMLVLGFATWWMVRPSADLPPDLRELVTRLEQAPNLEALLGPDLRPRALQLSGSVETASGPAVLSPVGTALRTATPRLQWSPRADAQGYRVHLERLDNGEVQTSPVLPAGTHQWTPPNPLAPGVLHHWEVEALGADGALLGKAPRPPQPEARFRILPAAELEELRRAEARWGSDAFVLGALRARAGLRDEALDAFAEAARSAPPGQAAAARQLLEQARLSR